MPSTTRSKRLYTVGNFSKFVRPGYQRIDVSGSAPSGVEVVAFQNPTDQTIAIVAINAGAMDVTVLVTIAVLRRRFPEARALGQHRGRRT